MTRLDSMRALKESGKARRQSLGNNVKEHKSPTTGGACGVPEAAKE